MYFAWTCKVQERLQLHMQVNNDGKGKCEGQGEGTYVSCRWQCCTIKPEKYYTRGVEPVLKLKGRD